MTTPLPKTVFTVNGATFKITGTKNENGRTIDTVQNITKPEYSNRFAEIERSRLLKLMKG